MVCLVRLRAVLFHGDQPAVKLVVKSADWSKTSILLEFFDFVRPFRHSALFALSELYDTKLQFYQSR